MAPAKTAAELQAEATAAAAREEAERRAAADRRSAGLWDMLTGWLPDFSFGNILMWGLILCGAYFLGRTEGGKELLGRFFGKENVDSFFSRGDGMLAGLAGSVGLNIDVSRTLETMPIDQVRTTLRGQHIPDAIIAVIAKDEATFRNLITTMKQANGGTLGINDLSPAAIINGPALDALLAPANRANTVAIMRAAMPANAGISEATLTNLITHNIGADGKPTPTLRRLLSAGVDGSLQTLAASLCDAQGNPSPAKAVDVLLDAQNRTLIRAIGTNNVALVLAEKSPMLSQKTLDAALAFGDAIDGNAANNGANRPRTLAVLHAFAAISTGTAVPEAFRGLTAAQLSGFFSVPGNQAAVANLLNSIDAARMPPAQRAQLTNLRNHWGNGDHGLAEVLGSAPDVNNMLRLMRGDASFLERAGANIADLLNLSLTTKLSYAGGKIAENAGDLAALMAPAAPPARPAAHR